MVKNLELNDFRAVRQVLEPEDFALTDGKPDGPPTDLIDPDAWDHIMTLPGDVAIRTSGFQGSRITLLNDITSAWVEILTPDGIVSIAMLDIADAFYSSTFSQLHGFYKEALSILRTAIETIALSTLCTLTSDTEKWEEWLQGEEELRFGKICDQLQAVPQVQELDNRVRAENGPGVLLENNRTGGAWLRALYRRLCQYSHARGNTTNATIWGSNGPIYSADGFRQSYHTFLEVHSICLVLAKLSEPKLPLTDAAELVFQGDSVEQYLDAPYRAICTSCRTYLWK